MKLIEEMKRGSGLRVIRCSWKETSTEKLYRMGHSSFTVTEVETNTMNPGDVEDDEIVTPSTARVAAMFVDMMPKLEA